jgi:hypothetical protein
VIGNHIDILDATFQLLGYTRSVEVKDEITQDLIRHGYHSEETVKKFLELRRFEQFEKEDDIIVSDDYKLCEFVTLKRVFHREGKSFMYVVMHCNHRKYDGALLDLFRIFLKYVENYVVQDDFGVSAFAAAQQYICNLFDGTISNVDEAVVKASHVAIPFQQDYRLYVVDFKEQFNTPLDKLSMDITRNLPFAYVLPYNRRIVIFHNYRKNENNREIVRETLRKMLAKFPCMVGISNPFENLWSAKIALEQASCAIEYGLQKTSSIEEQCEETVCFCDFEQCFLSFIVAKSYHSTPDLVKNSFMFQGIHRLMEYDKKHNTHLFHTLEIYLNCHQKATETGEQLNMHRNTVLYQIDRIEQLLQISLNDPDTSAKLLLGIRTYQSNMIEML